MYKVSKLKVGPPEAVDQATPPPCVVFRRHWSLPRARSSAPCRANLSGEVPQLHLGMPDAC